ncbi:MAG: divergent polysaccharide deacetylase family protein [bacterium]
MMARRKKKKKSKLISFILLLVVMGLAYLYIMEIKRVDYTQESQDVDDAINKSLVSLDVSDTDILKIYREEKKDRGRKWIHVTKEIRVIPGAELDRYKKSISSGLKEAEAQIMSLSVDKRGKVLTIDIGMQRMLMQTVIIKKIAPHRVAIILDDVGYAKSYMEAFFKLNIPLTMSVLPQQQFSVELAQETIDRGLEVMLHLPMEPYRYPEVNPGDKALLTDMSARKIRNLVRENIDSIPGLSGVNNHMGSKFTEDKKKMEQALAVVKQKRLFYIDSVTSSNSVAFDVARNMGIKTVARDVFIDNEDDLEYIKGQLRELIRLALLNSKAVGIGHVHKSMTAKAIEEMLPEFKEKKIELVFASELVQ